MRARRARFFLLPVLGALLACAGSGAPPDAGPAPEGEEAVAGGDEAVDPAGDDSLVRGSRYSIRVDNRGFRPVQVYALREGVRFRLGTSGGGNVTRFPARCDDFRFRETDFILHAVGGETAFLEGETIGDCEREIEIVILPIGLEFSRVWVR